MLRKFRTALAIVLFTLTTLLFLDFTGTVHGWFGWLARIQFLPAVMALNVGVILFMLLLTFICGRVYCSVICPLGIFQDIISWMSGKRKKKQFRFSYSPAKSWLRYTVLALFVVMAFGGISSFVALLAPYSAYGRIAQNLFAPMYDLGNNILAYLAERVDSYAFYQKEIWLKSLPVFLIAMATFAVLVVLAWKNGRTYCNAICPVGTVLSLVAKYSMFRPVIDTSKCNSCTLCSRQCKAACIDSKNHQIDYSRCVVCLDCVDACKHHAIHYANRFKTSAMANEETGPKTTNDTNTSRRNFLAGSGMFLGASILKAQEKKVDGGYATIVDKKVPERMTPIVPPGALGLANMATHCTGCQLCVSVCPNDVLRPSSRLKTLMQPESSYERGYCRPECTKCSEVCPAGAILKITKAEKSSIQVGHAIWVKENRVPLTDGKECGNCERHCPTHAITMVLSDPDNPESLKIPVVNEERCIGCGACENLCPARPFSAIYVEGHERHKYI